MAGSSPAMTWRGVSAIGFDVLWKFSIIILFQNEVNGIHFPGDREKRHIAEEARRWVEEEGSPRSHQDTKGHEEGNTKQDLPP
jgi:hypothetical protein